MSEIATGLAAGTVSFGPFRLIPAQRLLLEADRPVRLGSRARDILMALVDRPGEVVSKEQLIAQAWPGVFVEESNLKVHVAALRKVLGHGHAGNRYIANVPGRGYCFVAPVSRLGAPESAPAPAPEAEPARDTPSLLTRVIGRADIVATIVARLPRLRFMSIVGPGGMGKTTVALAAVERLATAARDGVRFVDLAPLTDPSLAPGALASVLGLPILSDNPTQGLVAFLRDKQMVLVLDSCERVVAAAAALAEEIFKGAPGVQILATSREPLRAEGERVLRLGPLGLPPSSPKLTAAEAIAYPAVQLFVERATASLDTFELTDADAPVVASICRRLDGMALAIELAASHVDAFGTHGVAARLENRLRLLTRGRRSALPRHRTLVATLDWSYALLAPPERAVLRRLAVFPGGFTLEAATAIAADENAAAPEIVDHIVNLIEKSLITADVGGAAAQYWLLDTTRAYALEKLVESGEFEQAARRHAEYFRDLFEAAQAEAETGRKNDWLAVYGPHLDNLRAALAWAFSPSGDAAVGVALTIASTSLWIRLSLVEECRAYVGRALASLDAGAARNGRQAMLLFAALGLGSMYTHGGVREVRAAWANVLEIAERLGDIQHQLRALWGLSSYHFFAGELATAIAFAERHRALAARGGDPADAYVGDRLIGMALHLRGDQAGARVLLERVLASEAAPRPAYLLEERVVANTFLSRVLCLQGFPEQALALVHANVAYARSLDHTLSLCMALAQSACPVARWAGDFATLENSVTELLDLSSRYGLAWMNAPGSQAKLLIKRGEVAAGSNLLRKTIADIREAGQGQFFHEFLGTQAETLANDGLVVEAGAVIDEALSIDERGEVHWRLADLLRVKADILLLGEAPDAAAGAEACFRRAIQCARGQAALTFELRAAVGLARLWRDQGRLGEARDLIAPIYARFTEGFTRPDLKAAQEFIA